MGISGTRVRRLPALAVAVAVVLATGCSGTGDYADPSPDPGSEVSSDDNGRGEDDGREETDQPDQSDQPVDQEKPDPQARAAVKAAIIELLRSNVARYEVDVPLGAGASVRESGSFRVQPLAYDSIRELASPDGTLVAAGRAVGDRAWTRLESISSDQGQADGWPCWVSAADIARIPGAPTDGLAGMDGQPPAAVVSASYGIGRQRVGRGEFTGTTDLALALGLLSPKVLAASGVDPQGDATVPATFAVERGVLAEVAVRLGDLPDAVEAAGGSLPAELDDLTGAAGVMRTRFTDVGSRVAIQPPAAAEVLVLDAPSDFEAAMSACGGR